MSAVTVRRVRLGAAFVLLAYLILHFLNHALGLISLDAMIMEEVERQQGARPGG